MFDVLCLRFFVLQRFVFHVLCFGVSIFYFCKFDVQFHFANLRFSCVQFSIFDFVCVFAGPLFLGPCAWVTRPTVTRPKSCSMAGIREIRVMGRALLGGPWANHMFLMFAHMFLFAFPTSDFRFFVLTVCMFCMFVCFVCLGSET